MLNSQAHLFALFVKNLSSVLKESDIHNICTINDRELSNRITRILRLKGEEHSIFFDKHIHIQTKIHQETFVQKNTVVFSFDTIEQNKSLEPHIVLALGLVKQQALEEIVHNAVQLGINEIQLLTTEKVQRKWEKHKEYERLKRIMIASAEQSKQFVLSQIHNSVSLNTFLQKISHGSINICFERSGNTLAPLLQKLSKQKNAHINVCIGPEGGLTQKEQKQLMLSGFQIYTLTPTTLRSVQAVTVGIGSIRSVTS